MEQKELIDYVCETVLKPLLEERGRIPFIEKILDELERVFHKPPPRIKSPASEVPIIFILPFSSLF